MRQERWDDTPRTYADRSENVCGFELFVYENVAHINAPLDWESCCSASSETPMTADELLRLAEECVWAARRLMGRRAKA